MLAAISLAAALAGMDAAAAQTATATDYDSDDDALIEITNLAQLDAMRYDLDGNGSAAQAHSAKYSAAFPNPASGMGCPTTGGCKGYELSNSLTFDADGDGDVDANDGYPNWTPIGTLAAPFETEFNGNNHSISRLTIRSGAQDAGLFGRLDEATVRDLNLLKADVVSASVHPHSTAGALAGRIIGGASDKISGVYVTGRVAGTASHIGGLAGYASDRAAIKSSCATATVASSATGTELDPRAGGLIGTVNSAGAMSPANIFGVCALGDVYAAAARANAGGLIGMATGTDVNIRAAYARGDVYATGGRSVAGGLAGRSYAANLEITASYSAGKVSAGDAAGALVGAGSADFTNSYWDATASGFADDTDADSPEGRTTTQLQERTSATGIYANWQNLNLGETMSVSPWIFGTASQYPVLNWGGLTETDQRINYDSDNDGLIEITTLAQLNAMRYDLDGNGEMTTNATKYKAAFRSAAANMGCAAPPGCKGYELGYGLTFDVNGDGAVDSNDPIPNWTPIGDNDNKFSTTFNGNGHAISKMTIDISIPDVGLFGVVGESGVVKGVGLLDADVNSSRVPVKVGALAGTNRGTIESSYATGKIASAIGDVTSAGANTAGGLVGANRGWIAACWADVSLSSSGGRSRTGGFVGVNYHKIVAAYSRGDVSARTNRVGGFAGVVGINGLEAEVKSSYSIGKPTGGAEAFGFTPLSYISPTKEHDLVHDSYWDADTSGTFATKWLVGGHPKRTAELQSQLSAASIYGNWDDLDLTNDNMDNPVNDPWTFGTASQYPVLVWGDLRAEDQYTDYDADGDGFIEITALAQLDAMRWDLDGDGIVSDADKAKYDLAFPYAETAMGCPSTGCNGYELARDLTFDTDGDGDMDSDDAYPNWTPIAGPFAAAFKGNGYAISKLKTTSAAPRVGLFGVIAADGSVKGVRLLDASVVSTGPSADAGALAGENAGIIEASYAGGAVSFTGAGASNVGGLVGKLSGEIAASWADASVSASGAGSAVGGLVGKLEYGAITASHARGDATGSAAAAKAGGLIGATSGAGSAVSVSYSTGTPTASGTGASAGGLVGSAASATTFTASYWDATTSGVADDGDAASPEGRTTAQLQSPTGASGIYADWGDLDLTNDGVANAVDDSWNFGTSSHYPALVWGGLRADSQYEDYDADDDGLIEIAALAQLNAVRYDLDGDGATAQANESAYLSAFPNAMSGMGCPYDAGCAGYELDAEGGNLTFAAPYSNWTPIGNDANPFAAAFEGNGQSLTGLTVSGWATRMGLFGKLDGATVRNLKLKSVNISPSAPTPTPANSWAGALAGDISGGDISGVYVSGRVSGNASNMGGLAGRAIAGAAITASCADVAVASTFNSTPGEPRVGGLIGTANAAGVFASCALGDVSANGANAKAGGLVGLATGTHATIRAAYATGGASATGARSVASGLVGLSHAVNLEITASYSAGAPTATNGTASGFARITIPASGMATISDSYWDTTASRVSDDADSDAPEGKTTTQLQSPIAATGLYAKWGAIDLTDDGEINKENAPWDFGTASQYPVIDWKGLEPKDQGR